MIVHRIELDTFVDAKKARCVLECNRRILAAAKAEIQKCVDEKGERAWNSATKWYEMSASLALRLSGTRQIPYDASNAFFKCVELLRRFASQGVRRLFDNASLPGDFIRAVLWRYPDVDWRANSLVGGLDDRFNLVRDNPRRWMMHTSMDGDVSNPDNIAAIAKALGDWSPDLYTSDLGFAVKDYDAEEREHARAHAGQVELGLRVLAPGGVMIVKTFTMYDETTWRLMMHMARQFSEFYIAKPRTSKEDNSECYWVGVGYRPTSGSQSIEHVYPRAAVNIATALTLRQKNKILRNVEWFRENARVDTSDQVDAWILHNLH